MDEKRDELENLMQTIDEKQAEVDKIQAANATLKIKAQQLQTELMKKRIINSQQNLNTIGRIVSKTPEVDISQFNSEHQDLINQMKNQIQIKSKEAEQNNEFNQGLEKEITSLISTNSEIENNLLMTQLKIKQSRRAQQSMNSETESIKTRINSIKTSIATLTREIKTDDKRIAKMSMKKANTILTEKSPESLMKELESIKIRIVECQDRIDTLQEMQDNIEDEAKASQEQTEQQLKHYTALIGWQEEKTKLTKERNSLKQQVTELKKANAESDSSVSTLQKRYGILRSLIIKWEKEDLTDYEKEANEDSAITIDSLLAKISAIKQRNSPLQNTDNSQRKTPKTPDRANMNFNYTDNTPKDKSLEIKKLEEKINQLQLELDRKLGTYRTNEYLRKESIDNQRVLMFDQEQEIINRIQDTKLKIALKKLGQQ